jgi:hypothetical protein
MMRRFLAIAVALAVSAGCGRGQAPRKLSANDVMTPAKAAVGPLRVSTDNPRYFATPAGDIVYLTGSHTWNNLQDWGSTSRAPNDPTTGEPRYRCQATDMLEATTPVRRRQRWDPRFYIKDLTSRNVTVGEMLVHGAHAAFNAFTRKWFNWRYPPVKGLAKGKTATANLNIRPGELVQVRSKEEIMQTLSPEQRNRGLWFDIEMVAVGSESTLHRLR